MMFARDTSLPFVRLVFFAKGTVIAVDQSCRDMTMCGASPRLPIINIPAYSPEGQFSGNTNALMVVFVETRLKIMGKVWGRRQCQ
jgi:hypothetical protein